MWFRSCFLVIPDFCAAWRDVFGWLREKLLSVLQAQFEQFLRNFSSITLSNICLNLWKLSRSSHGKESDNLNLCCVKKELSPSSGFSLTLTAVVSRVSFSLLSKGWNLQVSCGVMLATQRENCCSSGTFFFPLGLTALLTPLAPQRPLFQLRTLSYSVP